MLGRLASRRARAGGRVFSLDAEVVSPLSSVTGSGALGVRPVVPFVRHDYGLTTFPDGMQPERTPTSTSLIVC